MDNNTLITISWSVFGAIGVAIMGIVAWLIQKHISATSQNTIAIAVLSEKISGMLSRMDKFESLTFRVEKAEKDLNNAFVKIKEINS